MATQITKNPKRKDLDDEQSVILQGLDPDETIRRDLEYHNTGVAWDRQNRTLTISVGEFIAGYKLGEDTPLTVTKAPQPPVPSEDILDPETGAVVLERGAVQGLVPRLNSVLNTDLPAPLQTAPTTYGDLVRLMIRANDRLLRQLRPEYQAGSNIPDDVQE